MNIELQSCGRKMYRFKSRLSSLIIKIKILWVEYLRIIVTCKIIAYRRDNVILINHFASCACGAKRCQCFVVIVLETSKDTHTYISDLLIDTKYL